MGDLPSHVDEIDYGNPPFPLTSIDRELLSMKDEDFHQITWSDLKAIINTNDLEQLKRLPSDLRRYVAWSYQTKQAYGSITDFVIQERLHWTPLSIPTTGPPRFAHHSSIPFQDERDYAVLLNDWPYGFEKAITHMLVWSKTPIAVDEINGDVTAESRRLIEGFVERYFIRDLDGGEERVMWFKNWVQLQSVRGVDHVHVLARDVPESVLENWRVRRDL